MINLFKTAAFGLVTSLGLWLAMLPPATHRQSQRSFSATTVELPAPTGQFSIGTKIYDWVDHSRHELASKNPADPRQVVVQLWYPSEERSGPVAVYVPRLSSYRHVWEDEEVEVAARTLTHSRLNVKPLSGGKFPVVLLSHGWQGTRTEYTSLAEDLASHGYAVFGIDHPYMGRIALPNGDVTEPTEDQFRSPAEIVSYYADDLEFVIRQIGELNRADPEKAFTGKFDTARIAAIGHSSGFVAASGACRLDSRIEACINIDAPGFSARDLVGLNQPLLWIRLEKAGSVPAEYLKTAGAVVYELRIEGANHGSVEDWDYLEATSQMQREAPERALRIIREYVEAFLAKHLKCHNSDLLDPDSGKSGIHWRVYIPAARLDSSRRQP